MQKFLCLKITLIITTNPNSNLNLKSYINLEIPLKV